MFTVTVFTEISLMHGGMVRYWIAERVHHRTWLWHVGINAFGTGVTLLVTGLLMILKFSQGTWMVAFLLPSLVMLFLGLHSYYHRHRVFDPHQEPERRTAIALIPMLSLENAPEEIAYGYKVTSYIVVIHLVTDAIMWKVQDRWNHLFPQQNASVHLNIVSSPDRAIIVPLSNFIQWYCRQISPEQTISVLFAQQKVIS
jgi:hypothetical protein